MDSRLVSLRVFGALELCRKAFGRLLPCQKVAGLEDLAQVWPWGGFLVLGDAGDLASISWERLSRSVRFLAHFVELVSAFPTTP